MISPLGREGEKERRFAFVGYTFFFISTAVKVGYCEPLISIGTYCNHSFFIPSRGLFHCVDNCVTCFTILLFLYIIVGYSVRPSSVEDDAK